MSRARRKKQIRNRIIAFVMAVAMVFTVVKVNSGKSIVKAGEGETGESVTYTEESYLERQLGSVIEGLSVDTSTDGFTKTEGGKTVVDFGALFSDTTKVYNLYTASNKVKFTLPAIDGVSSTVLDTDYKTVYYYFESGTSEFTSDNVQSVEEANSVPSDAAYISAYKYSIKYTWKIDDAVVESSSYPGALVADKTAKLNVACVTAKDSDNSKNTANDETKENVIKGVAENNYCANKDVITVNCSVPTGESVALKAIGSIVNIDTANKTVSISDNSWSASEGSTDLYYGSVSYAVVKATDTSSDAAPSVDANAFKTAAEASSVFKGTGDKVIDGIYWVFRRYMTEIDDTNTADDTSDKVYYTESNKVTVNLSFILSLSAKMDGDEEAVTWDGSSGEIVINDADPKKALIISGEYDEAGSYKVGSDETETTVSADDENKFKWSKTIEADATANNGKSGESAVTTTVTMKTSDGSLTETVNIKVNYVDQNISITDVKLGVGSGTAVDASSYSSDSYKVNALPTVTAVAESGVSITTAELWEVGSGTDSDTKVGTFATTNDSDKGDKKQTLSYTFSGTASEGNVALTEGEHTFYIKGTNSVGYSADTKASAFKIFYDVTAPSNNSTVTVKQGETTVGENDKATSQKDVTLSFSLTDKAGSADGTGVSETAGDVNIKFKKSDADVWSEAINATKSDDTWSVTISKDKLSDYVEGGTLSYVISAKDNAGNVNDNVYAGSVNFVDERITITVTPMVNVTKTKTVGSDSDAKTYVDADGKERTAVNIVFDITVTSGVAIDMDDASGDTGTKDTKGKVSATSYYAETTGTALDLYVMSKEVPSDSNGGKYIYKLKTADKLNPSDGSYKISLTAENVNGYKPEATESSVYYVDLTAPNASLTGISNDINTDSSWKNNDDTTWTKITSDEDKAKWYKNVYVIVNGIGDGADASASGIDTSSIEASGMTEVTDKEDMTNGIYVYKVNDSAYSDTVTALTDVKTAVSFEVKDKVGNTKTLSDSFRVDPTAPTNGGFSYKEKESGVPANLTDTTVNVKSDVTISGSFEDNINVSEVTLKCTSAPTGVTPESGITAIYGGTATEGISFSPDGKGTACTVTDVKLSSIVGLSSSTDLKDGEYTITVSAKDPAGNEVTKTYKINLDMSRPVIEIDVSDNLKSAPKVDDVSKNYSPSIEVSTYKATYDNGKSDGDKKTYDYYKYASGNTTLTITVTDANITNAGGQITVKNGETPLTGLTWTKMEETNNYVATIKFPLITDSTPDATDGNVNYSISVTATDDSGNTKTTIDSQKIEFRIDDEKTAPTVTLTGTKGSTEGTPEYYSSDVTVAYSLTDVTGDEYDVSGIYTFTPAGSETATVMDDSITFSGKSHEFEDEGTYSVSITATDMAGNSDTTTKNFVIDKTDPVDTAEIVTTKTGKTENMFNTAVEVKLTSDELNEGTYTVTHTLNGSNAAIAAPTFTKGDDGKYTATVNIPKQNSSAYDNDGVHVISFKATDKAGNEGNEESVTFTIDTKAPELSPKLNGTENPADNQSINGAAVLSYTLTDANQDDDGVTLKYTFKPAGGSPEEEKSVEKFKDITFTNQGSYTVKLQAVDSVGNTSEEKTLNFVIDTTVPEIDIAKISGTASKMNTEGFGSDYKHNGSKYNTSYHYGLFYNSDVTLTVKVFDYDMDSANAIKVTDNGNPVSAQFSKSGDEYTAEITVKKPDNGSESHDIKITAHDKVGETHAGSNEIKFTIDTKNPAIDLLLNDKSDPEKDLRTSGNAKVGYTLSDDNSDTKDVKITYTFTPAGGSKQDAKTENLFDGATRTFTENGTYSVTVRAVDKAGNASTDSASFVIDKAAPELDLKITSEKPAKFNKAKNSYKPAKGDGYFKAADYSYEYGKYYNKDVNITVSVFDYDSANKNFVVTDKDKELDVNFDDKGNGLYTANITITGEGSHEIKATAVDRSGNDGASSTVSFIIDKTAPELTTTLNSEKYTGKDRFLAKDGVVGISVKDDNADSSDIYRVSITKLSDGSGEIEDKGYVKEGEEIYKKDAYYTVTYTVTDMAGNSQTASIGFTIDGSKPQSDIRITTKAPAKIGTWSNTYSNTNGHFNTSYTYGQYYNESVAMDMAVFDYNTDSIVVTDNDEVIPVTFSKNGDERVASSITISGEGEHVVKITVTDKSGNDASNTVGFTIDRTAPSLSATLNGSGNITDQYLPTDASVYLSVSDINEDEDDVTRVVKLTRPSASAENTTETGALEGTIGYSTEADYEITYTAIDRAGNESSPVTYTFRVDKTAPQLSITGITRDATSPENVTITYSMIEDFYWDVNSAEVKIYKKVDGAGESLLKTVDFKASGANSSMSDLFEEDGEYRFEFTAEDKTGNQANENFRFILDKNAPIITLSGVDGYLTDEDVTFGVKVDETFYLGNNVKLEGTRKTIDEPDGKPIEFDDYTKLTRSSSASFEQIFTEDGIYNIKVTSKDAAGNETVQNVQFTIDKTDPLIKDLEELADEEDYEIYQAAVSSGDTDAKKALIPIFNEFNFDYDADDIVTDLTTVTYKLYMDGVLYDGLSEVADGFHELRITAEDEVGNTAERTFYFILDTVKPGIIVTGVEEGDNLMDPTTITVSLQLTEDTLKSVKLNGNPVAISGNTASFEVSEKGDYELVIEAVDDAGNESTMTIKFEYGRTSSWLWWLIGGGAALIIAAAIFFIILGKKRKKDEK